MTRIGRNLGFDGRSFLTQAEWETYRRRKPVRYIRKNQGMCELCGLPETPDNPLQHAHIISFDTGVIELAHTAEYLEQDANIRTAHRNGCNQDAELDLSDSMIRLHTTGLRELPEFLPSHFHELWSRLDSEVVTGTQNHP